jgi:hypothetical protein
MTVLRFYHRNTALLMPALAALSLIAAAAPATAAAEEAIATDRPDFVESSVVVGQGRLQIETSVAAERDRSGATTEHATSTPTLLRIGVSDSVELRVETDGRSHAWSGDAGSAHDERGYADTSLGIKWHVRDAIGSAPSIGLLLDADLPSGSAPFRGEGVRPSLRVSGEWELPADMSIGVMPGIASDTTAEGKRFASAILAVSVGKEWSPRFRSFVEVAAPQIARSRDGGTLLSADTGVAWLLNERCQVDAAVSRGLNRRTPDLSMTVGLSVRL